MKMKIHYEYGCERAHKFDTTVQYEKVTCIHCLRELKQHQLDIIENSKMNMKIAAYHYTVISKRLEEVME